MGLSCKEVGGVQMDEMCVDDKWSGSIDREEGVRQIQHPGGSMTYCRSSGSLSVFVMV